MTDSLSKSTPVAGEAWGTIMNITIELFPLPFATTELVIYGAYFPFLKIMAAAVDVEYSG